MIIDINAFTGSWPTHPVDGALNTVRNTLQEYGVDLIYISPLEAAWCRNPHRFNGALYRSAGAYSNVYPVPVLDPTVATWQDELTRASKELRIQMIRLLPAYSQYNLEDVGDFLQTIAKAGLAVIVQTRLEDPRRQHPLGQVPDVPAAKIAEAAERHPDLSFIIGGPRTGEIRNLKDKLLSLSNLYADVSQADGLDAIKVLVEDGLKDKLLFGSHAPLFIPYSALSRVVTDLSDEDAEAILGNNAERLFNA
ncbi:MAG: amidohydrolase family protein [bacterium]|nr:amidohydrolase family protein [bacterium]